jgi:hypothetical protein
MELFSVVVRSRVYGRSYSEVLNRCNFIKSRGFKIDIKEDGKKGRKEEACSNQNGKCKIRNTTTGEASLLYGSWSAT